MEHQNILDKKEEAIVFKYRKRAIWCILIALTCFATMFLLVLFRQLYFSKSPMTSFYVIPTFGLAIFSLLGFLNSLFSLYKKEPQNWKSILALLFNMFIVVFLIVLILVEVSTIMSVFS